MGTNAEDTIKRLVDLYQQSRAANEKNATLVAEAAMTSFLDAEAAVTRMRTAETLASALITTQTRPSDAT